MHQDRKRRSRAAIPIALVLVVAGMGLCGRGQHASQTAGARSEPVLPPRWAPSVAPKDVVALLDGLETGATFGGFQVVHIEVADRQLEIAFERDRSGFSVYVTRDAATNRLAPYETERYDIFVGGQRDYGGPVEPEAASAMAQRIRERIAKTEKDVAIPAGL